MDLPPSFDQADDERALALLECYYGRGSHAHHRPFTGAHFDTWDSTGTRDADANRFTADDLVAVSFLSVSVPPLAARRLLEIDANAFDGLLGELGPDRDLAEESDAWPKDWAGWRLWEKLIKLPDVGATIASKLYARKRPRLRPIYDSKVAEVLGARNLWEPLRSKLQQDADLQPRLLRLKKEVGLPAEVSALRVFDVVTWMEGTYGRNCPWSTTRSPLV